jgi:glycerate kinase
LELPLADGGTGFLDVLHAVLGGELHPAQVTGPLEGKPVPAHWLRVGEAAYIEVAQACGLHLVPKEHRVPAAAKAASSRGVGELIAAAASVPEVVRIVVGLGGSASTDGGAGALAVLGAQPLDEEGEPLPDGGAPLARCAALAGPPVLPERVHLVLAADVDNPLLGQHGAAAVFGPQKGADAAAVDELERRLASLAELAPYRDLPGAGAGGGLGAALAALGGVLVEGAEVVLDAIGFDARARRVRLVVSGEGTVDATTLEGKAPGAVKRRCDRLGVRCELFGGVVRDGIDARALSGRPERAREDLAALGEALALALLDLA